MVYIIVILILLLSLLLLFLHHKFSITNNILHILAIISVIIIASVTGSKIYEIILNQTVFTMEIHGIFLNPFFLISGSYLSVYIVYRLFILWQNEQ